jgi:tetratricopeptide (TPR) repeat protein
MFENSSAESITSVLSPGTALVEFVALREVSWDREEGSVPARYCAFVLTPDHAPVWLDLAPAQDVESAAAALIAAIPGAEGRRLRPVEAARGDWRAAAATLAELVWAPVADAIGEMREVLLAPDAALCAIPFDVLPDGPDDKPLLATRNVSLVATGRDLVRLDTRVNVRSREPLVVAAPEFGLPAAPFEPLPGTIVEGDAIAELLGVKALSGPAARRETVLEATNPEIIHLATHGYAGGLTDDHSLGPIADCGVALAGANTAGPLSRDGVLTGLDVLGMRLDGTDLVVLSACDTGIGQLDDYEGLQGLSRSFIVGGARGVVSSLWKVSDAATAELMTDYYRRLTAERPRAWALADAKRAFYVAQPDRPELWAAFVSIGDPEPLVRHRDIWVGEGQSPVYQVEFGSGPVVSGDQFTEWAEVRYAEADATPFYAGSHSFEGSYLGLVDDELYKGFESIGAGDAKAALRHAKRAKKRLKTGDMGRGRGRERHARTLRLHGLALAGTGDSKGARKKMRASVAAYEELDAWPDQLAAGLDNLGILEVNRGRVDQGIKLLERALAFKLAQLPVDADQVEFTRDVLAEIARHQDAPAE